MGDTLILVCNSLSSSGVVWTRNASYAAYGYENFNYVYVNGSIVNYNNFLVTYSVVNSTNLRIYNIHPTDSGLYDCYEINGKRIIGYYVNARGMVFVIRLVPKFTGGSDLISGSTLDTTKYSPVYYEVTDYI